MAVLGLARRCWAAVVLMGLAACSPGSTKPTPRPVADGCDVSVLADWQTRGLAVLYNRTAGALVAMDVRDGKIRTTCAIPSKSEPYHDLPISQNGTRWLDGTTNPNTVLRRTQWISPNFRWAVSGDRAVVDLSSGREQTMVRSARIMAVGNSGVLVKDDSSWCWLNFGAKDCRPLATPPGDGGFVLNAAGSPAWVSARAVPVRFPGGGAFAVTDGERVYRAEFAPPSDTVVAGGRGGLQVGAQIDPTGRALFSDPEHDNQPDGYQPYDWFTVDRVDREQITVRARRSAVLPDTYYDLFVNIRQTKMAIVGGTAAVFSYSSPKRIDGKPTTITRFFMLVEGQRKVFDLSADRHLTCPGDPCQILAWPDVSLDLAQQPTPSPTLSDG